MLKILILSHRFYPDVGGIETNSEILALAFHEFGADVRVVTWTKNNDDKEFPYPVIRNPGLKALFAEHRRADVVFRLRTDPRIRRRADDRYRHVGLHRGQFHADARRALGQAHPPPRTPYLRLS